MTGFDHLRNPRELLPKAAEWIQAQGKDYQRTVSYASDSMEPHCGV
jgi:hypothetical protein